MSQPFKRNNNPFSKTESNSAMQQVYSSKQTNKPQHKQEEVQAVKNIASEEIQGFGLKRLKPFKEMEITEKLDHLATYIGRRAPFPCTFHTSEAKFKGVLTNVQRQTIDVKTFDDREVTIRKKDIQAITMIGDM